MGGSHVVRSEYSPFRIEPHFGKFREDLLLEVAGRQESGDVFEKSESWADAADCLCGLGPQIAGIVSTELFSGHGMRLAGKTRCENVNQAPIAIGPSSCKETSNVPEDRGRIKKAVLDPREKDLLAVGVALDVGDGSESEQTCSKDTTSSSGEKRKLTHQDPSH